MNKNHAFEQIKLLSVKIETKHENGTGVLFLNEDKAYILTVHHCIYGKEKPYHTPVEKDIRIIFNPKISNSSLNPISIKVYGKNIACLEIDTNKIKNKSIKLNLKDDLYYDEKYYLRGYPKAIPDGKNFNVEYDDNIDKEKFRITVENLTNDTSGDDAVDYIAGLSGSGVFSYKKNKLYLIGLVNNLTNAAGTFDAVDCIKISVFSCDAINSSSLMGKISSTSSIQDKNQNKEKDEIIKPDISNNQVLNIGSNYNSPINTGSGNQYITINETKKESFADGKKLFDIGRFSFSADIFYKITFINPDDFMSYFYYCVAKLSSMKNISKMKSRDIDRIYNFIEILNKTSYKKESKFLWLIVFYEYSEPKSKTLGLERKENKKIKYVKRFPLSKEEKNIFYKIPILTKKAKMLLFL